MQQAGFEPWRRPLLEATLICSLILGLFFYWFAVADRYAIFLYGHTTMGIPQAQPFDALTSSRYWMAGLVASGVVLCLATSAAWLQGRVAAWRRQRFVPAAWWRVWLLCAAPLGLGIPAITMTVNSPTLPLELAVACFVATWLGLAVALLPAAWAAARPVDLLWLSADGAGLLPVLTLLRAVELPSHGVSVSPTLAWVAALGGVALAAAWLAIMSGLRRWRKRPSPNAVTLFVAGLGLAYVLMPLVHHLFATPPQYRYITSAGNFFAFDPRLQLVVFLVAAALALGVTTLRRRA